MEFLEFKPVDVWEPGRLCNWASWFGYFKSKAYIKNFRSYI